MKTLLRNCLGIALAAALAAPAYADEVTCTDGTTSESGRGACSHHGGIAKKAERTTKDHAATPTPTRTRAHKPATPSIATARADRDRRIATQSTSRWIARPNPAKHNGLREPESIIQDTKDATARCNDGHLSYAAHHSGACSDHGGVAAWLDD